jgi:hypothetical protein
MKLKTFEKFFPDLRIIPFLQKVSLAADQVDIGSQK